jgi:hypothetical protein
MCNIILPYIDNADWITEQTGQLISVCTAYRPGTYHQYQSFSFVDGTGYVEQVFQEIDFVLSSNRDNCFIGSVDEFMRVWELEDYACYKLSELSGGWRKFLGLALFTNVNCSGKIYFDAFRQLSDRLIALLLKNLMQSPTNQAYFFEYDVTLFPDHVPCEKVSIAQLENGISLLTTHKQPLLQETNY